MMMTMMRSLSFWLVLLRIVSTTALAIDDGSLEWTSVASLPEGSTVNGRHHPITFANETHAFLLTGSTRLQSATSDMYLYEEATDSWTTLGSNIPFPPRSFGYGVVLPVVNHPKAFLGFGAAPDGERLADFWEFDMTTLAWTRLADFPGPGRRHPAMNVVRVTNDDEEGTTATSWEIHVGLGDGQGGNYNDWWSYDIATDSWNQEADFPGSRRHHPFYFGLGSNSYAGLGHSDGFSPYIERDWYRFETASSSSSSASRQWQQEADFESYSEPNSTDVVTTEARVAGTQFAIELSNKSLGFVLSGDGDDHSTMETGEFHVFDPTMGKWFQLPPHPGPSRWAPGSFVMRGTARAYFTCGYDRSSGILYGDMWKMDLTPLFASSSSTNATALPDDELDGTTTSPSPAPAPTAVANSADELTSSGSPLSSDSALIGIVGTLLSIVILSVQF